ncbi:MAG TPA: hypothetical protein VGI40_15080 [Pirellulaceae bacterium]
MIQGNSSAASNDADEVQRQMREIRAELRDDVHEIVESANKMADLSTYVSAYPWLCVGAALAAGYLVVPQRAVIMRPDAEAMIELAKKHKLFVNTTDGATGGKVPRKRGGVFGELLGLAAATLLQGGLKIVTAQLAQAFAPPQAHSNGRAGGVTP